MNPTESLQTIGPWGWLGWALFTALSLLFYRQWTSDPHTALRNMRKELDEARKTIAQLRDLEKTLTAHNAELTEKLEALRTDNADLKTAQQRMEVANEMLRQTVDRMERKQKADEAKLDEFYRRVVQLQARLDAQEG